VVEYYLPPVDGKRCCPIPEKASVSLTGPGQAPPLWTFQIYDARKERGIAAGNSTTQTLESGWLDFQLLPNALDMDEEDSEHCGHYQLRIMRSSKPLEQGSCVTLRSSTMDFVCKARSTPVTAAGRWDRPLFLYAVRHDIFVRVDYLSHAQYENTCWANPTLFGGGGVLILRLGSCFALPTIFLPRILSSSPFCLALLPLYPHRADIVIKERVCDKC
jgi:hypothetical protein